ncbi:MAG: DUF427 domain-containing protein [Pseudomonadota bacterium]
MRPDGIVTPGPGQESVWDYPRPPMLQRVAKRVRVDFGGQCIVDTAHAQRICETASPPTYYVPPADIAEGVLVPIARQSLCEWKGDAAYFDVQVDGQRAPAAAWCYPSPFQPFGAIAGWIAFMPAAMQACFVGEDRVVAQPGGFYGGWITPELTGPFKGAPGTGHW